MDEIITHDALNLGQLRYKHLEGLPFIHGSQDCYELARRMYKDNMNIELASYARPDDWWLTEMDLYKDNFQNEGFLQVEINNVNEIRILDAILMGLPDMRSPMKTVTNHCGIYIGNGKMIHHRLGKLSQTVPYRGVYRNFTTAVIRHKDIPDLAAKKETSLDLMDLILPHKREALLGALNDKH